MERSFLRYPRPHIPDPSGAVERVLVCTPTYNERDNIEEFCKQVLAIDRPVDLLVIDDNSPDGTGRILERIRREESRLTVLHRPGKLGLGSAHKLGMLYAIRNGYDVFVLIDSDLSHDPAQIPALLDALAGRDFVTGSRYMKGGVSDYTGYRRLVSVLANLSGRALLGIPLHELTTCFRVFRTEVLRKIDLSTIRSQGYSFAMESLYRVVQAGFRCGEVAIHFRDRKAGKSKIPRLEVFNGMAKLLELFVARWLPRRAPAREPLVEASCGACGSSYVLEDHEWPGESGAPVGVCCLMCGARGPVARRAEQPVETLEREGVLVGTP
jgi:dolichol-phosphate mannosyltransferase